MEKETYVLTKDELIQAIAQYMFDNEMTNLEEGDMDIVIKEDLSVEINLWPISYGELH